MPQSDLPLVEAGDLGTALKQMTTLPAPEGETPRRGLLAVWAWPLAGLLIAVIAAVVGVLLRKLDMGSGLAAAGVLLALMALTGARHDAALARAVTKLFGAQPGKAAPEEMSEPQHPAQPPMTTAEGTPGQMSVLLITLARWSALTSLLAAGYGFAPILAAAVLSRAALPVMMVALRPIGGAADPAPPRANAALALVIALTLALFCLGWALIPAVAAAGVMAVALSLLGYAVLGGRSADFIQAAQPVIELSVLAALLAAL